jgi:hypothetical protein
MMTLEGDTLTIEFPEVHQEAKTEIRFHRTLRIPDNGKEYPLPPGLGLLPLRHVDDCSNRMPRDWLDRGGIMLPLYQAEAMWIGFNSNRWSNAYPFAIKIAAGKINAVNGRPWTRELDATDHDYVVAPHQPWLDGFAVAKDVVRQFVAMPLGAGYSAEEQITGKAEWGGLQIIAYPMRGERYEALKQERERRRAFDPRRAMCAAPSTLARAAPSPMALAPGGRMRQQIYADPYGIDAWDMHSSSRCFVTLLDAVTWAEVTGSRPPQKPLTATEYTAAGLPWFDYYDAELKSLAGAPTLSMLKSVAETAEEKGVNPQGSDAHVEPKDVVVLGPQPAKTPRRKVREIETGRLT